MEEKFNDAPLGSEVASQIVLESIPVSMHTPQLPSGRYCARLIGRETLGAGDDQHMQLTFEVASGDYAGVRVNGKFWSRLVVARALWWAPGQSVTIDVTTKRTSRGGGFSYVTDVCDLGQITAAEFVSGVPEDNAKAAEAIERANAPEPIIIWEQFDSWCDDLGDEFSPPDVVPLCDSTWAELICTVGPTGLGEENPSHCRCHGRAGDEDGCDYGNVEICDAEDDADCFRWVLGAGEDPNVVVRCIDWSEMTDGCTPPEPDDSASGGRVVHSVFEYGPETKEYLAAYGGSLTGYRGVAWARWLPVDLTSVCGLQDVIGPARRLCGALEKIGVQRRQILILNRHNLGLRILIPSACADAYAQTGFEAAVGHFWQLVSNAVLVEPQQLKKWFDSWVLKDPEWHAPIDRSIYLPNAMTTAINTASRKNGFFKVVLTLAELEQMSAAELEGLAKQKREFIWPSWRAAPIPLLSDCWDYAIEVERSRSGRYSTVVGDEPFIYPDSFRFIRSGAPEHEAKLCFIRAARNLLNLRAPSRLVLELLGPGAALSGMGKDEAKDLIDWVVQRNLPNSRRRGQSHYSSGGKHAP